MSLLLNLRRATATVKEILIPDSLWSEDGGYDTHVDKMLRAKNVAATSSSAWVYREFEAIARQC
jgi:hypothetical protein